MPTLSCILVVDHDETANFLNERLLRQAAIADEVRVNTTSRQAFATLSTLPSPAPELLLVSWHLERGPDISGKEFLAEVRRQFPQYHPVIALLALHLTESDVAELRAIHRGPIFNKPLKHTDIERVMHEYFFDSAPSGH